MVGGCKRKVVDQAYGSGIDVHKKAKLLQTTNEKQDFSQTSIKFHYKQCMMWIERLVLK